MSELKQALQGERGTDGASLPRARGLVPGVVQVLEDDIREGRLRAGDKLPTETALMERFGVSRTVVREAISRLQASGQVATRHGIGTFVQDQPAPGNFRIGLNDLNTLSDVISLLELRISLESEAAGLAAQRRTDEQLSRLAGILAEFEAAITQESEAVPSDFQFHLHIAQATGNRHFADLMSYLGTMIIPRTRIQSAGEAPEGRLAYLRRVHAEHEGIFRAIAERDAEGARAAMRVHLTNSRERLRRAAQAAQEEDVVGSGANSV